MYNTDMPSRNELPSSVKLIRSTIIAALVALVLLLTVVMPAEYAFDPTGAGRLLGLTEMGEIKVQLEEEVAADEAAQMETVQVSSEESAPEPKAEEPVPMPVAEPQWQDQACLYSTGLVTFSPGAYYPGRRLKLFKNYSFLSVTRNSFRGSLPSSNSSILSIL